jgi:NAD(P)-dependent dehydrogenase (short-subunit alcohol dehydrogenase family)
MVADNLSLAGKIAIVTGSGRENGIGAAIAKALARNGASVTINHVSESVAPRAEKLAESIRSAGGKATVIAADVTTREGAEKLVNGTLKAFGVDYIDILGTIRPLFCKVRHTNGFIVNNSGYGAFHDTLTMSDAEIQKVFAVNMFAAIHMVRCVVPHIRSGGRIVNISSISWKLGFPGAAMYSAAKAAIDALSGTWAAEVIPLPP